MDEVSRPGSIVAVKNGPNSQLLKIPLVFRSDRELVQLLLLLEITPRVRCYYVLDIHGKSQKLQGKLLADFPSDFKKWQYDHTNLVIALLKGTEEKE